MNNLESQLIEKIKKNFDKIKSDFQSETRKKDFERYFTIKQRFNSGVDIKNDDEFQRTYKTFYVMRFVTNEYTAKYFNLLNTKKFNTPNGLKTFLKETDGILNYRKNNAMQFSFATKALHTANNNLPIYDRFISKFFQLATAPNDVNLDTEFRAETRKRIYNELLEKFERLLSKQEIKKYIKELRTVLCDSDSTSDAKMLDFIILSCESEHNKNLK